MDTQVVCVDKKRQWSRWRNVWHSSAIRSTLYMLGAPGPGGEARVQARSRGCLSARTTPSSSARAPTGSPRPSRWPGPAAGSPSIEGADTVGGGCRSEELTLPGFVHDSAPRCIPGARFAVPAQPAAGAARAGAGASRACRSRTPSTTARRWCWSAPWRRRPRGLGPDAQAYRRLFGPLVRNCRRAHARDPRPASPAAPSARCWRASASSALRSATGLARSRFEGERARALLAGVAAPFDALAAQPRPARPSDSCSR